MGEIVKFEDSRILAIKQCLESKKVSKEIFDEVLRKHRTDILTLYPFKKALSRVKKNT